MGTVYKAKDIKLNRNVAIKFLPDETSSSNEYKRLFKNEAQAAAALNHPNIAIIYAIEEADELMFIVMEFIEGKELFEIIKTTGPVDLKDALNYAKQIADGLQIAHASGIIHGDIKSTNIMITDKAQVKIMDFGLAKVRGSEHIENTILGTPAYMSPEQAQGMEADERSDIWSMGVVLYEMLTGELPFGKEHIAAIIYSILNEVPKPIHEFRKDIDILLREVVKKMLHKNLDQRYQNINELQIDLKLIPSETKKEKAIPSIAVLPFINLSPNPENEYFVDGLVEDIINNLTSLKNFNVAARTSTFLFKGKNLDIREIGRKLNVEHVLEGSVRIIENRIRVNVQLINVSDGYPVYSEKYDRIMENIFMIQDEITFSIIENLKVRLLENEEKNLAKRYTENVKAYNLYLKGRFFFNQRYKNSMKQALAYFEKAIEVDPMFALAYSGIADCYHVFAAWHFMSPKIAAAKAQSATNTALKIDNNLTEGYNSLAMIKMLYEWQWHDCESTFKKSIKINSAYALAHCYYGFFLSAMGRKAEAISEAKKATELEPLSIVTNAFAGFIYYQARQYDWAIQQLKHTLEIDQNSIIAFFYLAITYLKKKMYKGAIKVLEKSVKLVDGSTMWLAVLGMALALSGKTDEAKKILEKLEKQQKHIHVPKVQFVWIYTGLGEIEQALKWLEKAYEERDITLMQLKVDPIFDELRSEPQFEKILAKMSFIN